ncbi:MAG: cupin domain-containing protein [bacterium]
MKRQQFLKCLGGIGLLSSIPSTALALSKLPFLRNLKPKITKNEDGDVLNVIGDIQTHKLVGSDTDNQIVEWVDNVSPGVGIPPHIHTKEDEIFRVIKGQIEIMVDGQTTILKAGDTAFAPKNIVHSWKVVGTDKAQMITSAFPAGIEIMFRKLAALPEGPPNFEKVTQICGEHGITFTQ